tara:strand:+ start:108 stop:512 length:405 start_codon:yes stop_codon:yes gene_type:complete
MIKLCFKEYDIKFSLEASKSFRKSTGEDLAFVLSRLLECWRESKGLNYRQRINDTYSVCDFELAASVFFYLIRGSGKNVDMQEIEDAMFRVGIFPNDIDNEWCLPWPVILRKVAEDIEKDFYEDLPRKKSDIVG